MRYSDMSQLLSKLIRFLSFFFLTLLILVVILKLDLVIPISLAGAPSGIQLNPYNGSSAFDDLTTSIAFQSKNSTSSLASSAMKPLSDSTQLIHDISENVVLALIEKRYVDTLRLWFLYHAIEQKVEIPGQ